MRGGENMPGLDRTGPWGAGPITGRGFGPCGLGLGWRQRFGPRRGLGRYFNWNWPSSPEDQKKALEDYKKALQEEIEDVEKELANLQKQE